MITAWLGLLGPLSIMVMLVILGLICRRFGQATGAAPYYLGLFVGAFLVGVGLFARAANLMLGVNDALVAQQAPVWALLYDGLPALGLLISLVVAWRYWSWLLADRD
jgi:hypothetical protein